MPVLSARSSRSVRLSVALAAVGGAGLAPAAAAAAAPVLTGAVADSGRWIRVASVPGAAIVAQSSHVRIVDAPARAGRVMVVTRTSSARHVQVRLRVRLLRQRLAPGRSRAIVRISAPGGVWVESGVVRADGRLRWGVWVSQANGRRRSLRIGGAPVRPGAWTPLTVDSRPTGSRWVTSLTVDGRRAARITHTSLGRVVRQIGVGLGPPPTPASPGAVDVSAPRTTAPGSPRSAAPRTTTPRTTAPPRTSAPAPPAVSTPPPPPPRSDRWYAASSSWNTRIGANPPLAANSSAAAATFAQLRQSPGFHMALREWTVPVYYADARTPRHTVAITAPWTSYRSFGPVPIPDGATPDPQGDGHLMVIDASTGCEYDFWQAKRSGSGWSASWGNSTSINGTGSFAGGLAARGSGFALGAGLIRPEELAAGRIDHALFAAYPYTKSGVYVAPATKTDGRSTRADALPMGARLQLDPSLDLNALGLSPHEKTIARAMQEYGVIIGDTGGFNVYAVHAASYPSNPYPTLPTSASAPLRKIPIERLRVLSTGPELRNGQSAQPPACGTLR